MRRIRGFRAGVGAFASVLWLSACVEVGGPDEHLGNGGSALLFGPGDRIEYRAIADARVRALADGVAGLFLADNVACEASSCTLTTRPLEQRIGPLCEGEPLKGQREGAFCTAFLIAPDLMVTAGHCLDKACNFGEFPPQPTRVVFGFALAASGETPTTVPAGSVYQCSEVLGRAFTGLEERDQDFAVFRLDRPVTGRTPLSTAPTGSRVDDAAKLMVIGHPEGVPLQVAPNGSVRVNANTPRFYTDLDHLPGNSGSPVIDESSGRVVGLLATTPSVPQFVSVGTCSVENACDQQSGCGGSTPPETWAGVVRIGVAIGCRNGVKDGFETAVDCGGLECVACGVGSTCTAPSDCASGRCEGGQCALPFCEDGVRDNGESDVDCGTACFRPCAVGQGCADSLDCASNSCVRGTCQEPSCTDGQYNGTESDLDCGGGACKPCRNGAVCFSPTDCLSGSCNEYLTCVDATCPDGVKDGNETGVDCGGSCVACADGEACKVSADCQSGACRRGRCVNPLCFDHRRDGAESDRDCGGGSCEKCGFGRRCASNDDCASGNCRSGHCRATRAQCD